MTAADASALLAGRAAVARARSRGRSRPRRVTAALALATLLALCVGVSVGDYPIPLLDVPAAIAGAGDRAAVIVAQDIRLPHSVTGLLVGLALGLAGAIFQAVARNPLASPDILGVTYGSAAIVVLVVTTIGATFWVVYLGSLAGALAMGALIYVLAYREGVSPYRFVLVGISLGLMASAVTFFLISRADLTSAQQATVWLIGSLNSTGWHTAVPTAAIVVALAALTLVLARRLRVLQLGDDTSRGLGVTVERSRLLLLAAAMGLVGASTAAAGPISFVAFMAGPIARRLTGSPATLVPAALTGAVLVLAGDVVARRLFAPVEIPVGVITGMVGAPYLLWLLARANRVGAGG